MTHYHYTNVENYEKIKKIGYLSPYRFRTDDDFDKEDLVKQIKRFRKNGKGIYLWREMNESLCRDFYFYQRLINGVEKGVVLQIQVPKKYCLLSKRMKYDYDEYAYLYHNFKAGIINHENVRFDVYLSRIPIEYISKIMEVSLSIKLNDQTE